jgi:hypothetical protein
VGAGEREGYLFLYKILGVYENFKKLSAILSLLVSAYPTVSEKGPDFLA